MIQVLADLSTRPVQGPSGILHGARSGGQFGPLPSTLLWQILLFMGALVAVGVVAAWLMHEETRGVRPNNEPEEREPPRELKPEKKRRARKRKLKVVSKVQE